MSPILGIWASQGRVQGDFESIATVSVGAGGSGGITFSSIPQTYKHLQVRGYFKFASNEMMGCRLNSDSASGNHSFHYISGDGSSAAAGAGVNVYSAMTITPWGNTSNPCSFVLDLLDYTNTNKNKTIRTLSGNDSNGSGSIALWSGVWLSTAAVSTLEIVPISAATITQYSHFALYGCK